MPTPLARRATQHGLALVLLLGVGGCSGNRAVRVVVEFEGLKPGCLEVTASDPRGGATDSVQLVGEALAKGQVTIGVGLAKDWSQDLDLRVRSFEGRCDGPMLEEQSRPTPLRVEGGVVGEWVVTLTAVDADGDGFAVASPGVKGTDCDDASPARHPGATEACGARDTNCDGLVGCLDPLCEGSACDDGVASTTVDVCLSSRTCGGKPPTDCVAGTQVTTEPTSTVDRGCSACPAGTFTPALNATACTPWSDCAAGQYVSVPPSASADRTCAPCAAGFFSAAPNSSACAAVGQCAPGSVQAAPASSTTAVQCTACSVGSYCAGGLNGAEPCAPGSWDSDLNPASSCVPWSACLPGATEAATGSTTSDRTCAACPSGTWDHDANAATACAAWTACLPGSTETAAGSTTSDRTCAACPSGTWDHDANGATACVAWSQCQAGAFVFAAGTTTVDVTCSPCATGSYSTTTNAASCLAWTACQPGQRVSTAGTALADQGCAACASGSFSATLNAPACTAWKSCDADTWESGAPSATSDRVCSNYTSCLDRLTRAPTTSTGAYLIDPDGPGATAPFQVKCDMTTDGGGWTVISFEDFSTSATGWSDARRDTTSSCATGARNPMLGGNGLFGSGASSSKTYGLLGITHSHVRVALDYFVIDSWDNETAQVSVDGALIYSASFNSGGTNICGGGWGDRWLQAVTQAPAHTANTMLLTVTSTLNQDANDESFGVDNVSVMVR